MDSTTFVILTVLATSTCIQLPGRKTLQFDQSTAVQTMSSLIGMDSSVSFKASCFHDVQKDGSAYVDISWSLYYSMCLDAFYVDFLNLTSNMVLEKLENGMVVGFQSRLVATHQDRYSCGPHIEIGSFLDGTQSLAPVRRRRALPVDDMTDAVTGDSEGSLPKATANSATSNSTKATATSATSDSTKATVTSAISDSTKATVTSAISDYTKATATSATSDYTKATVTSATSDSTKATATSATSDSTKATTTSAEETNTIIPEKSNSQAENNTGQLTSTESTPRKEDTTKPFTEEESRKVLSGIPESVTEPTSTPVGKKNVPTDISEIRGSKMLKTVYTAKSTGFYFLIVVVKQSDGSNKSFNTNITVSIAKDGHYMYASAFPLLVTYGVLSGVYVIYALFWLGSLCCYMKDLLRVQFWIGGVIFLGMIENSVFYSMYQSHDLYGEPANFSMQIAAEVISAIKRALSRIMVLVVCMGFGIVKPRLGQASNRVLMLLAVMIVVFIAEGVMRVSSSQTSLNNNSFVAVVTLATLDTISYYWIFISLYNTLAMLKVRRNEAKLALFKYLGKVIGVSVVIGIIYTCWSIYTNRFKACITTINIWMDDAIWPSLFCLLLGVIIFLWRPSKNNQRYAYTPVVDFDDDDEDEEVDPVKASNGLDEDMAGAIKLRNLNPEQTDKNRATMRQKAEEDLRWVEENLPTSSIEFSLLEEEDLKSRRIEASKMQ